MQWIIPGIIVSYLIGSIPTAYIFGRRLLGIDIRKFGSGNVGATNALRVLGKPAGVTVLFLDIIKGFICVFFLGNFMALRVSSVSAEALRIILGFSCICGHNWTVFLRFKGGKGVATSLGVLVGLAAKIASLNWVLGLTVLTWLAIFLLSRIISVASVTAAIALPIFSFLFKESPAIIVLSAVLAVFVVLRHQSNLKRFFRQEEKRIF